MFNQVNQQNYPAARLSWECDAQADRSAKLRGEEELTVEYMMLSAMDVIQHTQIELWKLYIQRQSLRGNGPYEIGFLVRTAEERYRRMVDLYNTSITMDSVLRTRDHILHLQTIEKLHWDIMHLANMLHEVEKKYRIKPQQLEKREFYPFGIKPTTEEAANDTETATNISDHYDPDHDSDQDPADPDGTDQYQYGK